MKVEIRCCCNPGMLLGTVEVPEAKRLEPEYTFRLPDGKSVKMETGAICNKRLLVLDGRMEALAVEVELQQAIKSMDLPIETLRKIPTFEEAK
jgi:hypothetical protein